MKERLRPYYRVYELYWNGPVQKFFMDSDTFFAVLANGPTITTLSFQTEAIFYNELWPHQGGQGPRHTLEWKKDMVVVDKGT